MKNILTNFTSPGIISFVLVFPFMILELVHRRKFPESFPIVLFGLLWLLPMLFIVILMPIVRNVQAGNSIMANPINLLLRFGFGPHRMDVGRHTIDQLPCFLGVPNCD